MGSITAIASTPTIDPSIDRPGRPHEGFIPFLTERGFQPFARLAPRHARDITGSSWSIGCETCDRGYVDFDQVGPHLGELGAKGVRLQAGWARCEPNADGQYDWAWLDRIVDSAVEQGVKPWLQTSYGNPGYEGGGGIGLSQGIPTGDTALVAWDAWVRALVERYGDRVDTWEIWNEPDHNGLISPESYADFFIRTATILRDVQPQACIIGLALAGAVAYAEGFLRRLADRGEARLLNRLAYHYYPHNPDLSFDGVDALTDLLQQHAPQAVVYQGETGAPSETTGFLAMRHFEWSERKQAVWNLRRLLAHHARGIGMNLFQLADMQYARQQGALFQGRNAKGQLSINDDMTVAHRKASYYMAQNIFSVLDDRYPLVPLERLHDGIAFQAVGFSGLQQFAWTPRGADRPDLVCWWRAQDAPTLTTFGLWHARTLPTVPLGDPVLVDWLSGVVFEPPVTGDDVWRGTPVADAPFAMAERETLPLRDLTPD